MRKIAGFGGMLALMLAVLALLNWLPGMIQKQKLSRFDSIESVRKRLSAVRVYLPTYLPEHLGLAWPPAEIFGQDRPFGAVIMHFRSKDGPVNGLVIHEVDSDAHYSFEPQMKIVRKGGPRSINVKDRQAHLVLAECDGSPCSSLSWHEGGTSIDLIGKCPAQELVKIASSMISGGR